MDTNRQRASMTRDLIICSLCGVGAALLLYALLVVTP
jgi:hypothetical protein